MQRRTDCTGFLTRLVCLAILPFFVMVRTAGELPESESLFNFIRAIDPKNELNITWMGSALHPCLLHLNGIKCNSDATNVVEISLVNMNLSGILDTDSLCRLQKLKVVNLAKNFIRENIPDSILHCTRLMYLNLSSNQLSGRLPKALAKLKYLRELDISNNNLSGIILKQLGLRHQFSFSVVSSTRQKNSPREMFMEVDRDQPTSDPPSNNSTSNENNKPSNKLFKKYLPIIVGIGVFLLAVYFLGKTGAKLSSGRVLGKPSDLKIPKSPEKEVLKSHLDSPIKEPAAVITEEVEPKNNQELVFFVEKNERFTLEDLHRASADLRNESFSSNLYMVKINDNAHYAVKRFKNLQVSPEEFGQTMKQINKVKHRNILPLVGYRCTGEEKLIIYKYQSNGSLANLVEENIKGKRDFPWKLRLSIACGIARGLAFIYDKWSGKEIIPHGNLKLSNILLNDNNEPVISEYGLSKFLDPSRAFLFSSHGYTAPEKTMTEKGDVYSFGVILMILLTGKSVEVSGIDLPRWVKSMVREEWTGEVFDKKIEEAEYQWAFPVLNIALMGVSRFAENRPSMEEILEKIEEVMEEHEQQLHIGPPCCPNASHEDCCSLHKIIPDTWDSPGSNY
ncbi:hypothetical protein L6164_029480 [Bauhinia variegata]|uniref:Uncharacterized protein n=1 Tax=Bauhinia variegata TaxID=167791 RepID=A0ACB9L9X4_BAUVA|nr:hypothetical protein L6164_029480 [Bauhinia variegata]